MLTEPGPWGGESRLPDDWEERTEEGADLCARCGRPLQGPKHTIVELQRVVAMRHGGLALQGVSVHHSCWANEINQDRFEYIKSSPVCLSTWDEMIQSMRQQLERLDGRDREGEEWKGEGW